MRRILVLAILAAALFAAQGAYAQQGQGMGPQYGLQGAFSWFGLDDGAVYAGMPCPYGQSLDGSGYGPGDGTKPQPLDGTGFGSPFGQ